MPDANVRTRPAQYQPSTRRHAGSALARLHRRYRRPSDAIALAIRFKAPVYVADHVLEEGNWTETIEE